VEMDALWNSFLTAGLGFIIWWAKNQHEELKRVQTLLNRTREEMAKEYVTKTDSSVSMNHFVGRFDRLEEKIDRLMER